MSQDSVFTEGCRIEALEERTVWLAGGVRASIRPGDAGTVDDAGDDVYLRVWFDHLSGVVTVRRDQVRREVRDAA